MSTTKYSPRLSDKYKKEVVPALMKRFSYSTVMQVPRLEKICINRGVNGAVSDKKLVDVAIDQGGCFETSRPTTHEEPTYYVDGILHYCVANIPGAVPYTSTLALTNATLPYAIQLADKGWRKACAESEELRKGLNVVEGKVVYKEVAEAWDLPFEPLEW
jgi:alanine dehydrogenase